MHLIYEGFVQNFLPTNSKQANVLAKSHVVRSKISNSMSFGVWFLEPKYVKSFASPAKPLPGR